MEKNNTNEESVFFMDGRNIRLVWQLRESKGKKENIGCFGLYFFLIILLVSKWTN